MRVCPFDRLGFRCCFSLCVSVFVCSIMRKKDKLYCTALVHRKNELRRRRCSNLAKAAGKVGRTLVVSWIPAGGRMWLVLFENSRTCGVGGEPWGFPQNWGGRPFVEGPNRGVLPLGGPNSPNLGPKKSRNRNWG